MFLLAFFSQEIVCKALQKKKLFAVGAEQEASTFFLFRFSLDSAESSMF